MVRRMTRVAGLVLVLTCLPFVLSGLGLFLYGFAALSCPPTAPVCRFGPPAAPFLIGGLLGAVGVVHVARLEPGVKVSHELGAGRGVYVYLIGGAATFDGEAVTAGDAAKVTDQDGLTIKATDVSELILVDVPMTSEPVGIWRGRI